MGNCLRRRRQNPYSTVDSDDASDACQAVHDTAEHSDESRTTDEIDTVDVPGHDLTTGIAVDVPGHALTTGIAVDVPGHDLTTGIAVDVPGHALTGGNHLAVNDNSAALPPINNIEEFPFLSDERTVNFLTNSQTMFIMRGVPGCGKSVLGEHIKRRYSGAVVCSADHYFYGSDGHYRFEQTKLSEAHQSCQEKATRYCETNTRVVIIDNTHIQQWEMAPYLRLAQSLHHYHVFIVEPNTPWRLDPAELVRRNTHNVHIDIIKRKVDSFKQQNVVPIYYGWFLLKEDSASLLELAKKCMREVSAGIQDNNGRTALEDMLRQFESNSTYVRAKARLHCTAKYAGGSSRDPYHTRNDVQHSIGRVFTLRIESFIYSPRAIGARVRLDADELNLFSKDEELLLQNQYGIQEMDSDWSESRSDYREPSNHDGSGKQHRGNADTSQFKHGCSAHITISFRDGFQPKVAGDEVLWICEEEQKGHVTRLGTSNGVVCCYEGHVYQFILRNAISFKTLFHGFYTIRR